MNIHLVNNFFELSVFAVIYAVYVGVVNQFLLAYIVPSKCLSF